MMNPMAGIQVDKFYPPTDWLDNNNNQIDIRKNAEDNTIVLLYGVKSDFSAYSLFGLLAQVSSGTYDVYIDDVLVGSGITSNTQYDIDFSTINTSYGSATTPEVLVLHKVVVKPTTSGERITTFVPIRTSGATGNQKQGVLWLHFELSNQINISNFMGSYPYEYSWANCYAITAKGDYINNTTSVFRIGLMEKLQFVARIKNVYFGARLLYLDYKLKRFVCDNLVANTNTANSFDFASGIGRIEQIVGKNIDFNRYDELSFEYATNLKILPTNKPNSVVGNNASVRYCSQIFPTKIDCSNIKNVSTAKFYGSSIYPMRGLRGLKVSNEAPFSGSSPQINVSYTGLDRDALVELFNSLPAFMPLTKVGSPTISSGVVSGFSDSNYIQLSTPFAPSDKDFEIVIKFKCYNFGDTVQQIFYLGMDNNTFNGIDIISAGRVRLIATSIFSSNPIITIDTNKDIWVRLKRDGNSVNFATSVDGVNYGAGSSATVNGSLIWTGTQMFGLRINQRALDGEIDLNPANSYIKLNGIKYQFRLPSGTETTAANPTLSCVAATGNNLTVVGSPTIDENGVASGFSSGNILAIPSYSGTVNSVEIVTKIPTISTTLSNLNLICSLSGSSDINLYIASDNTVRANYLGNGTRRYLDTGQIINNGDYIKLVFSKKGSFLYYSTNGYDWAKLKEAVFIADLSTITGGNIGYKSNTYNVFNGSIDLEQTYIKVGHNYLIKGYLTENDKNIALNKGWSLTLS